MKHTGSGPKERPGRVNHHPHENGLSVGRRNVLVRYCWVGIKPPSAYWLQATTVLFIHACGLGVWIGSTGWFLAGLTWSFTQPCLSDSVTSWLAVGPGCPSLLHAASHPPGGSPRLLHLAVSGPRLRTPTGSLLPLSMGPRCDKASLRSGDPDCLLLGGARNLVNAHTVGRDCWDQLSQQPSTGGISEALLTCQAL